MAEETKSVGVEIFEDRMALYRRGLKEGEKVQLEKLGQETKPIEKELEKIFTQISDSIDSIVTNLEQEYATLAAEHRAKWETFQKEREEAWEKVETLGTAVKEAEEADWILQAKRFVMPKKKAESKKNLESLREQEQEAKRIASTKYRKSISGVGESERLSEVGDLLYGRSTPLREVLKSELIGIGDNVVRLSELQPHQCQLLRKFFPELMKKMESVVKQRIAGKLKRREVEEVFDTGNLGTISVDGAKDTSSRVDEGDLRKIETKSSMNFMNSAAGVVPREKTVYVSEDGSVDWSLKENSGVVCNAVAVRMGVFISPESISTLPVEAAVHVVAGRNFREKYMAAMNELSYSGLSKEAKQKYPTFESWKEACVKSLDEKMKEVEMYKQAKSEAWDMIEADAGQKREWEESKPELKGLDCPSHILDVWYQEERKKPSSEGLEFSEIFEIVEKRWYDLVRKNMEAIKAKETESENEA